MNDIELGTGLVRTAVDTSGIDAGVTAGVTKIKTLGPAGAAAGREASAGLAQIGPAAETSTRKAEAATRRAVATIQREIANVSSIGKTGADRLETLFSLRGLDTVPLKPYIDQLRAAEAQAEKLAAANVRVGMSGKQLAFATRGVPAQFADIATSLAAGQSPLMVLMQQGGQLKDMFGGIGPAAKALGGYVAGLVNPFTVAAAAVGGLALAYQAGSKESEGLTKQLVISAAAAKTSVDQLYTMAGAVSASTGDGKGGIAETLGQIAATGKVATANMALLAEAAVRMEQTGGKAADEMVKEFAELGKSPVEASIKLNEQYNYLTASVYSQIKALNDQGRTAEAASLAQTTLAKELIARNNEVESQLGTISKLFLDIERGASRAWSGIKSIGRTDDLASQLAGVNGQLEARSKGMFTGFTPTGELETQKAVIEAQIAAQTKVGEEKTKTANLAKAQLEWEQRGVDFLGKKQKLETEIAAIRETGKAAGASQLDIETRVTAAREKYKEAAKPNKANDLIADLEKQLSVKKLDAQATGDLSEAEKQAASIRHQLATGTLKATDAQKLKISAALEDILTVDRQIIGQKEYATALKAAEESMASQREKMFSGNAAIERQIELFGLTEAQISAVSQSRLTDAIATAKANGATAESIAYLEEELALIARRTDLLSELDGKRFERADFDKKNKADIKEETSLVKDLGLTFSSAFEEAVVGGKKLSEVLNALLQDIAKLALRKTVTEPLLKAAGGFDWGSIFKMGGGGQTASELAVAADINSAGLAGFAKGAAFSSPSLHSYVNTVQSTPKYFGFDHVNKFAKGGIFAEAGPEAVMPLTRDSSGRLGVRSQGGGAGSLSVIINNNGAPLNVTDQRQSVDSRGHTTIEMMVDQQNAAGLMTPGSHTARAMEGRFGAKPALVGR